MLDNYLKRENVRDFISEIKSNPRYNNKTFTEDSNYSEIGSEIALYIFYDALIKYVIIINNEELFDTYVEQLDLIYKKVDSFNKIKDGLNRLICSMVATHLKIDNVDEEKDKIIAYIYNKYILNGYFVHGFCPVYANRIKTNGFVSEIYDNNYIKMKEVQDILNKYGSENILDKDFSNNRVYFTDDYIMGMYYSSIAPSYFFNLLCSKKIYGNKTKADSYLKPDYDSCISNLKRFMSNKLFSDKDKKRVLEIVQEQWNYINSVPKKIGLLFVKRDVVDQDINVSLDEYLKDDVDLYESIERMLNPKYGSVSYNGIIGSKNVVVYLIDDYYNDEVLEKVDVLDDGKSDNNYEIINKEFMDAYGSVYIYLLVGACLISLGVIISIIMVMGG